MSAYQKLKQTFHEIHQLSSAMEILNWDGASMMPSGGAEARAEQMATLGNIVHSKMTSHYLRDLLTEAESETLENDWDKSNLALMRHDWKHANAVSADLVEAISRAGSKCEHLWRSARAENDFESYLPLQQEVLNLARQVADAKAASFGLSKYDALLDQYDAGRTSAEINVVFADLKTFLPDFTQAVLDKQASEPAVLPLEPPYSVENQRSLGLELMKNLGFDFNHGRLDTSHHPFCGGGADDVRITTRYDENDFTSALMGVLHETGHALYEQGLPKEYRGQPVGNALGMSIHESQSLLIEMQVCRGEHFLRHATPLIQKAFGGGDELSFDNMLKLSNKVDPSFIRVDADELTYPAHVMLRYEIETKLINGDIEFKHVPELWKLRMKEMLNVVVVDYANGCMQDVHWTDGSFGYFPTYTLGAMHAAQFFHQAKQDCPNVLADIENGDFTTLLNWLRKNIHSSGSKLTANDLLCKATGETLNAEIFKQHLKDRYL